MNLNTFINDFIVFFHKENICFDSGNDKRIFDEIVTPICPQLSFLSTSATLSTQTQGKPSKSSVDDVKMNVDDRGGLCR